MPWLTLQAASAFFLNFKDILVDKGKLFFVWWVRVVPLSFIRKAVAKGAVASDLAVRTKAAGCHKRSPEVNNLFQLHW